jgi:hypothetical protein
MIGRTYLEAGSPVRILIRWGRTGAAPNAPIGKLEQAPTGLNRLGFSLGRGCDSMGSFPRRRADGVCPVR